MDYRVRQVFYELKRSAPPLLFFRVFGGMLGGAFKGKSEGRDGKEQ